MQSTADELRRVEGVQIPDADPRWMMFFFMKVMVSGLLVAIVSSVARRYPGVGGLIASLPLISVLGMVWLWLEKPDPALMAAHARGTFWFVLPSLPMFLLIPLLLRKGIGFWPSLAAGCGLTIALYALMLWLAPKLGLRL